MKAWRTNAPAILSHPDARPEQIPIEMSKMKVDLAICMKKKTCKTKYPKQLKAFCPKTQWPSAFRHVSEAFCPEISLHVWVPDKGRRLEVGANVAQAGGKRNMEAEELRDRKMKVHPGMLMKTKEGRHQVPEVRRETGAGLRKIHLIFRLGDAQQISR